MSTTSRISLRLLSRRSLPHTPGGVGVGVGLSAAVLLGLLMVACGGDAGKPFGADGTGGDGIPGSGGHPGSGGRSDGTGGGPGGTGAGPAGTGGRGDAGSGGSGGGPVGSGGQSQGSGGAGATPTGGTSTGGKVGGGGSASGGHPGTGGGTGLGGNPSSGTGGKVVGTGGSAGGAAGSGGRGGGAGTGGAGGTGGDPAAVCNDLVTAYANEIPNAKICSTTAKGACSIKVSRSISCPGCQTFVNDDTELKLIIAKWQAGGCDKIPRACPAIACLAITDAVCKAPSSGTDGTCSDSPGVLTPGPTPVTTTATAAAE